MGEEQREKGGKVQNGMRENGMKGRRQWKKEENRKCRSCGIKKETWEHVQEECGGWGEERS